jgi:hypothetical protein
MSDEQSCATDTPVKGTYLRCCCCGGGTRGRQWWNRDTGFGLCDDCIDYVGVADVAVGATAQSYGVRGWNWDIYNQGVKK